MAYANSIEALKSVKEIYGRVKKNNVGFATVYRSLKLFNELGITKEISIDNIRIKNIILRLCFNRMLKYSLKIYGD